RQSRGNTDWRSCGRNRRRIPIPRYRTPIGCTESYSRAARRRSLRFLGRASPNSAAKKTQTHPDFATGRCPCHSPPGHPDRIRPSSAAHTQARDFARREYRLLQPIQSPQRLRKKRRRTLDRRGKAYGLSLVAPNTRIFRKLAGNVGESAASMRLLLDKVNKS